MIRRRPSKQLAHRAGAPAFADFHGWVLSLPWVVERPKDRNIPSVRYFAVDCEPLGLRRVWLVTGLSDTCDPTAVGVAVILPLDEVASIEDAGRGRCVALLSSNHALLSVSAEEAHDPRDIERVILDAYGHAMTSA
jgi:hypothetical protein